MRPRIWSTAAVAFDVLRAARASYLLRAWGFLVATTSPSRGEVWKSQLFHSE